MKDFLHTTAGKICTVIGIILLVGCLIFGGLILWYYAQPKFADVTVELGQPMPPMEQFLTEHGNPQRASFVTDPASVSVDAVGDLEITLSQDRKEETVILHIVDTVAPTAQFQDLTVVADALPEAADFVVQAQDLSPLTFTFTQAIAVPADYAPTPVGVLVTDAGGNTVTGNCTLNYIWVVEAVTLPLGQTLTAEEVVLFERDAESVSQVDLDAVNAGLPGVFLVTSTIGGQTQSCTVTVEDREGPVVVTQNVTVLQGAAVTVEDFLESVTDVSQPIDVQFVTVPSTEQVGQITVQLCATDAVGNETLAEATLTVEADTEPPVFADMNTLYVEKGSNPDYTAGVTVTDNADAHVEFTVDSSAVDLTKGGTYIITYTATDAAGNEARYRRKVEVIHNQEDTRNLIKQMAERAARNYGTGVEDLRDFVRNSIGYSSGNAAWGGDDPIWYGFTQFTGNCYVHAVCLEALLEYYGYTYQEIYTTHMDGGRPSHYWVIVDMGGYWRHVDATPGSAHSRYSLMNDEQRYETLYRSDYGQRDWDRSKWPACE